MNFDKVGHAFAQIEATSGRVEMTKQLAALLKEATPEEASIICNISLGQLNPPHIGTQFQMAEKNMIKVIADLLHTSENEIKEQAKEMGDLGLVVAQGSWMPAEPVSIQHVYGALHQIEQIAGTGSQEEKINSLRDLLAQVNPISAKYIVRIVLGKLRLGFSDMTIIDALSWLKTGDKTLHDVIEDAYNICADIGLIAHMVIQNKDERLFDFKHKFQNMSIHIGIPIRPAAAERLPTARAIVEKIGHCIAQPKLDGFRLQIHMDKTGPTPQIHFFSRNLQDMSAMFPDIKKAIAHLDVKQIICEGEAIVYDVHSGHYLPFQETVKRKRKHDIEEVMEQLPLRVIIFDLLYVDGQEYMSKTHHERRDKALALFKHFNDDAIQVIEEQEIATSGELEDYFVQNIASGLEGLVVKKDDSVYKPGKRNFNWIKLKRQEEGHLEDTIDCVVLGYYAGEGKRAAFGIGACLVGVYNKLEDRFETVAKIGTGFKDLEWIELKKKCDALQVPEKPKNVVCDKMLEPDVWVSPELVVVIRADEITMSPVHAAGKTADKLGYALRFPRFMGYSIDKSADDATTIEEIEHLYKDQFVR